MSNRLSDTINIGVSDIFWTPDNSDIPIYLGLTKGGATVKYETDWHTIKADQVGTTPMDDVLIGESVTAEVNILDTTKRKIDLIMAPATAVGNAENPTAVTFGQRPGLRATHHAGKLVIHPVSMGDDKGKDVIIYRTSNTGNLELSFKLDDEWIIPCVFKGYYEDFRKPGDQLFRIGEDDDDAGDYKRVIRFWITPSNPDAEVGDTIAFRANAMYEDGSTEDVTERCDWVSSNPEKVTLSGTKVKNAKALEAGTVVIRAEFIGYSNSTSMTVS